MSKCIFLVVIGYCKLGGLFIDTIVDKSEESEESTVAPPVQ